MKLMVVAKLLIFAVSTALAKLPTTAGSPSTVGWMFLDVRRLKELEEENSKLKRMFANLSLENEALKAVIAKKL